MIGVRWRQWFNTRDKADTLLLLLACVTVLAPHALHLPAWASLICAVMLLWRAWITLAGKRLPPRALLLPIAALSLAMVRLEFHTLLGRDAGVAMLVLLLAFKLLEMRARRDLYVVAFLGFFILLTNLFYSQSPGAAAMMLLAVLLLLTALLSFQYTGRVPPLTHRLRQAGTMLALASPVMLVLFLLFPRIQGPLWGLPSDAGGARTGLSDRMAPGTLSELAHSDELAFRVKFSGPAPNHAMLYWRGIVLSDFDGVTWTQRSTRVPPAPIVVHTAGRALPYEVTQEASAQRWLFALEMPRAIAVLDDSAAPANSAAVALTPELEMLAPMPLTERVRYRLASHTEFNFQANETIAQLQINLRLPAGLNPRTLAYAHLLRQQSRDDTALIASVLRLFHEENFRYTLRPPLLNGDAVDQFLFGSRAGFCEHYAGAFAVLMRAAGIPARIVTGYQGGETNPVDGVMAVRQSDAHAWTEVWLRRRGWVRIDPTAAVAPQRIEKNLASAVPPPIFGGVLGSLAGFVRLGTGSASWLQTLRFNLAAIGNAWNQWVLDYTPQRQHELLRQLGIGQLGTSGVLALILIIATLALLPLISKRPKRDKLDTLYSQFCQLMARHGCARLPHEGPLAFRTRLLTADESARTAARAIKKQAAARFLSLYTEQKYGLPKPHSSTESDLSATAQKTAALKQLQTLLMQCR